MAAITIYTDRLVVIPMTYRIVRYILNKETEQLEGLGIKTNDKWPLKDTLDILQFIESFMDKGEEPSGFDVWMIVRKDDMTVIGDAGFKGEPNEYGEIEIGFGLIEEEQGKGYGYEVARALIRWALSKEEVKTVKADCLICNTASINLLKKCGMKELSRDSEMIYWELSK